MKRKKEPLENPTLIMGIDPGDPTGIALVRDGEPIHWWTIPAGRDGRLFDRVSEAIREHRPGLVAYERPFILPGAISRRRGGGLREKVGLIKAACRAEGVKCKAVAVPTWKAALGLPTKASKGQVQQVLDLHFNIKGANEHEADAIGIALAAGAKSIYD